MLYETFLNLTSERQHVEKLAKSLNDEYNTSMNNSFYHCISIIDDIRSKTMNEWYNNDCIFRETDEIEDIIYTYILECVNNRLNTKQSVNKAFYTYNIDIANNLILVLKGG